MTGSSGAFAQDVATSGPASRSHHEPPAVALPLVSVIVVNHNYGRFLDQAVSSVFAQTYPHVECVVVDNASTDETPDVLAALSARHPAMRVVRRPVNDGQTPASLDGLADSSGQYVIFLDADDYLLPICVETHVYVHLSLRPHVGFTSGDMLQLAGDRVVVSTGAEPGRIVRRGRHRAGDLVRPFTACPNWPSAAVAEGIAGKVHYLPPLRVHWVWSPTSGLCYRRDALMLFADNERLRRLRTGTDVYFAYGCGGLSGSAIIDTPLFAYRIHGSNIYSVHAQLDGTYSFRMGGAGDSNDAARFYLIDHLVECAGRFAPNLVTGLSLLALLFRLDARDRAGDLPRWARRSRVARAIVADWDAFSHALGSGLARLALAFFARSPRGPRALAAGTRDAR